MAAINIDGRFWAFTVSGVSIAPTAGATYTTGGVTYTVRALDLAGVAPNIAGTIYTQGASVATPAASGTLTKASGTGDATISYGACALDARIDGVGMAANGDTLSVYAGQRLIIDRTPPVKLGNLQSANTGLPSSILVRNTSTTTPIVLTMNTQNSDIWANYASNRIDVQGDWVIAGIGNGAASQTISFAALWGGAIDFPPCVWVETGDTRHKWIAAGGALVTGGYFMPFFNCGKGDGSNVTPDFDVQAINILTHFYGDFDHGPVFQYDLSTRIATFGKGGAVAAIAGGAIPPAGARIIYPNIHFTSDTYDAVEGNRNQFYAAAAAQITVSCAAFSRFFWSPFCSGGHYNAGACSLTNVGMVGRFYSTNGTGTFTINNVAVAPATGAALTQGYAALMQGMQSDVYGDFFWTMNKTSATYAPSSYIYEIPSLKQWSNIWAWQYSTVAGGGGSYPIMFESVIIGGDAPVTVGPLYCIGGGFYNRTSENIHVNEFWHADSTTGVTQAVAAYNAINTQAPKFFSIGKIRKLANGAACRGYPVSTDPGAYLTAFKDINYDAQSNAGGITSIAGERVYVANAYVPNLRGGGVAASIPRKNARQSNVYTNNLQSISTLPSGSYVEWQTTSNAAVYTGLNYFDTEPFNPFWSNAAKTAGGVNVGPFAMDKNMAHRTVVAGTEGVDFFHSGNAVYVGGAAEIWWTSLYPIRGITNFSGAAWSQTGTNWGSGTNSYVEVALRNNDDLAQWGSWFDASVAANWQSALNAISGYSSNLGFFARVRLRTTAAYAGGIRYFNYAKITCTPDPAWTPAEIGFVPINVTGLVAGSTVKLYDRKTGSDVRVVCKVIAATADTLDMPYDFDGQSRAFRLRVRKAGCDEVVISSSTWTKGQSVPISQTQRVAVDEVAAAAMTGIAISGNTSITVTEARTLQEVYAFCQWWASQTWGLDFTIPMTTVDGISFSSSYALTINGATLGGSGTLNLGAGVLTMSGGAQSGVDITHSGGAKVWTRIGVTGLVAGSRVQLYDSTAGAELYNGVPGTSLSYQMEWSANRTIRMRCAYQSGTTAKLPIESSNVFGSGGCSFLVSQSNDPVYAAIGIDGNLCSSTNGGEFTPDYPNLYIDANDADNSTQVQRVYAWACYGQATSQGIAAMFKAVSSSDGVNFMIDTGVVNARLFNQKATPLTVTGGYLYRSDGSTVIAATSNSIQMDPSKAYLATNAGADLALVKKLLRNRRVTDPSAGTQVVYDDDDVTVLASGALFEDAAGTQRYRGQGAERAERLG